MHENIKKKVNLFSLLLEEVPEMRYLGDPILRTPTQDVSEEKGKEAGEKLGGAKSFIDRLGRLNLGKSSAQVVGALNRVKMRKQEKIFLIGIIILLSAVIPYTIFKAKIVQEGEPTPITYYYQSFYNTTEQWGLHDVPESTFIADINEGYLMDNSTTIEHFYYDYTKESHPILVDNMASCIEFANGYWWVSGWQNNHIYKYYENWTYTGVYVPLGMIASFRYELGYWWVISMMDGQIHKYYTNWTHTGFSRPILV